MIDNINDYPGTSIIILSYNNLKSKEILQPYYKMKLVLIENIEF